MNCRICNTEIQPFMSFGRMPLGNGFLTPDRFDDEYFFELQPAFCDSCKTLQITEQPDPGQMFHDNYAYFSSTSRGMITHFDAYADMVAARLAGCSAPFVVEIGCNDGILLHHFAKPGYRHLGVEPSANVAAAARTRGLDVVTEFFNAELARGIVASHGQADAVIAANVICHIPDFHALAAAVEALLAPGGIFVFEEPYLGSVIELTSYDQIYDEHIYLFSLLSLRNALFRHGLTLIDAMATPVHGGSMRYVVGRRGEHEISGEVDRLIDRERAAGLDTPATFDTFRTRCEASRDQLMALLNRLRAEGKRIVGYGATSKSTTVANYCGIGTEHIEFISDTTPTKQGKYTPGTHIPVLPYEAFCEDYPDYAVLFAWNHRVEIMAKETKFSAGNGKWIEFVPSVSITS